MARRRHGGHDEGGAHGGSWKIALADMMTVLMAFFLVMWLASIVEPEKRAQLADALMNMGKKPEPIPEESSGPPPEKRSIIEELKPITAREIKGVLKDSQNVEVEETPEYIRITLKSDHFFESGRATITDRVREELEKLAELMAGQRHPITITGYTDNVPIHTLQFPSNWELSAARAATVARVFIDMDVDRRLITVQGRADNEPVAPNDTKFGRAMNRRVVILVDKTRVLDPESGQFKPAGNRPDRPGP